MAPSTDSVPPRSTASRPGVRAVVSALLLLGLLHAGCVSDDDLRDTCRLTDRSRPPPPPCSENLQPIVNECGTFDPDEQGTDSVIPRIPPPRRS